MPTTAFTRSPYSYLFIGLKLVATHDRLFVLPASFAFHWTQTSLGLLYFGFTGREVPAIYQSEYRPMVLIGLGCCLALAVGIRLGLMLVRAPDPEEGRPNDAFSFKLLVVTYFVTMVFEGSLNTIAADYPSVRQIIVTIDTARLGVLFLILRRLFYPVTRWAWIACVVLVEVGLGITGFFAGFREPVVLAGLAMLEIFDRRNIRHWGALVAAAAFTIVLGLLWMGIRVDYRREYVDVDDFPTVALGARVGDFESGFGMAQQRHRDDVGDCRPPRRSHVDRVLSRPRAQTRAGHSAAHERRNPVCRAGAYRDAESLLPRQARACCPTAKKCRKYSGVMVAGAEQNTSIAFGYAAEAYIDFGVPLMFLPVAIFGVAIGCLYVLFRKLIWHRELFVAFATVAFWLSLYLFERSWATMLGVSLGMMVYLGVPVVVLDRFLLIRFFRQQALAEAAAEAEQPPHPFHA